MLRHEHVAVDAESVPTASILEDRQKYLFDAVIFEERLALVATAGDKVRTAGVVAALESRRHGFTLEDCAKSVGDGGHVSTFCASTLSPATNLDAPSLLRSKRVGIQTLDVAG